jgi:hypothetical protein
MLSDIESAIPYRRSENGGFWIKWEALTVSTLRE